MNDFEKIILLLMAAILLVNVAKRFKIPAAIVLVVGGGLLSFVPGLNFTYFDPNLILSAVLPPILYYAAFWISMKEFKRNFGQIFSLALSLVFVTTLVVGLLFKWFFPDYPWALAFAFGAIVSPPDAAATTSILKHFSISPRLVSLLEGESLVNDASALVLYRIALTALLTGVFSIYDASVEFAEISVGGILIGFVTGYIFQNFSKRFLDPLSGALFSFCIPYVTYFLANGLGFSGVLAVVVNGLVGARILIYHQSPLRRIIGGSAWDLYTNMLNCFIFILIGSQLDELTAFMTWSQVGMYTFYAFLITLAMIVVRMIWVWGRNRLSFRDGVLVGWAGMRGIVSLTASLAIPWTLHDGTSITGREVVIFMTFMVIMFTIILPAATIPALIRWLKLEKSDENHELLEVRKNLAEVADVEIARIELNHDERNLLKDYFSARYRMWERTLVPNGVQHRLEQARRRVIQAQRKRLIQISERGLIDDIMLKNLERELDFEETPIAHTDVR